MSKELSADELVDLIEERRLKAERDAYPMLRSKCFEAVTQMIKTLRYDTEVEIAENEMPALNKVTEEMRDLGYKFRFIEVEDTAGNSKGTKLFISVHHAR